MVLAQQGKRHRLNPISVSPTLRSTCLFVWLTFEQAKLLKILLCLIGRSVRDGREADLHEAQARQPLHAGTRLFQNLLLRAMPLHSL